MHIARLPLIATALAAAAPAAAAVRITEFMYVGLAGGLGNGAREFIELTNIGSAAVDLTGWTYNDDNPNNPVAFGSAIGMLGANESMILTERTAAEFRTYWGLASTVKVFSIAGNSNIGSNDTINIYNSATQSAATLVDTLTYADGTARPGISRNRPVGVAGVATNASFVDSAVGDAYGSTFAPSTPADLGNPGRFPLAAAAPVPEPATWAMLVLGFGITGMGVRRRRGAVARA